MAKLCFLSVQNFALSHNALRLAEAVNLAAEAQQNREPVMASPPKSVSKAIGQVAQSHRQQSDKPTPPPDELSFESLFRQATQPVVAEEVPA